MADRAILVIDSDMETAQRIESALESEDYLVFIASTEEFGITMARKVNPVLIFVNPAMSGGTGLDVCRALHELETRRDVPIIVLSPFEGEMDPRYRSEYGIVDALGKSFAPEELIAKTAQALSFKPSETALPEAWEPAFDEGTREIEEDEGEKTPETGQETPWEEPPVPEEPLKTGEATEKEDDEPLTSKKAMRRRRSPGSRITVPVIAAALLAILAAAGFIIYKTDLIGGKEAKKPVAARPVPSLPQKPGQESPLPEQKESTTREKPAAPSVVSPPQAATPSAPAAKEPAKKPAGKAVYSVQVGAFKDEKNAEAVVRQFKEKGYEAFVQSIPRDKEMLHRVLIGKFENRKEAWKLAGEIGEKENLKAVVTGD
jgi:DNA-binding response OmpR family regulator